jgi:hypothetical protein
VSAAKPIAIGLYCVVAIMTAGKLNAKIVDHPECDREWMGYDYCASVRTVEMGQEIGHLVQGAMWPLYWGLHLSAMAFQ